jgi:manganese/zinc/iron transport system permease protein
MGAILVLNLLLIGLAWKELKLATVDPGLAALLGFSPVAIHYSLMAMVSITAVGAFDAVGSILVVALMIAPPATAYLLVDRFAPMLWVGAAVAAASAILGYGLAFALDVSIAGSMAVVCGILFTAAFLLAPRRGLVAQARRRSSQRLELSVRMLLVHLLHHQETESEAEECQVPSLHRHLQWSESRIRQVVREAEARKLVSRIGDLLHATTEGRSLADAAVVGESE